MRLDSLDLSQMREEERQWFEQLNRLAENREWSASETDPKGSYFLITQSSNLNLPLEEMREMMLVDSLMVGLYTREPVLAFRCYAQVREDLGRLVGQAVTSEYQNAATVLKTKVEAFLPSD